MISEQTAVSPLASGSKDEGLLRVVLGTGVGTVFEWYDFLIYGTAAALVFNKLFFPNEDPLVGTIAALAAYAAAYAVRPLGGIVLGHFGDKLGRKKILMMTLIIMAVSTTAVGLLPTYQSAGIWAPILLIVLRLTQGFGAGAEFASAAVMLVEFAPKNRRGLYGSLSQVGVAIGILLATGVFIGVEQLPNEAFLSWGWRVPFLISALLLPIAAFLRLQLSESPIFMEVRKEKRTVRIPFREVLTQAPGNLLRVIGCRFADNAVFYMGLVFILAYAKNHVHITNANITLVGIMIGGVVQLIGIPLAGYLSDRIGRRPLYAGGALLGAIFGFPFFLLADTGNPVLVWVGIGIELGIIYSALAGAQPALFCELFPSEYRLSGVGGGRELGAIIGGATPAAAAALLLATGSFWGPGVLLVGMCLVTFVTMLLTPETYKNDLD